MKKLQLIIFLFLVLGMQSQEKYAVETSWTDVVTSQPEGFVVNEDGNVSKQAEKASHGLFQQLTDKKLTIMKVV